MADNEYYFKRVSEMTGYELLDLITKAINKSSINLNKELPSAIGKVLNTKNLENGGSEIKC